MSQTVGVLARLPLAPEPRGVGSATMPYGIDALTSLGWTLSWDDRVPSWTGVNLLAVRGWRWFARRYPGLQGLPDALFGRRQFARADVVLSVFEDVGLCAARLRRSSSSPWARAPLVILSCWLAEDSRDYTPRQLDSVRRSLLGASRVIVYSANQVAVLRERFDLPDLDVVPVHFGVATEYYTPADPAGRTGGILAVGRDRSRDYRTFLAAVRDSGWPVTLVCYPENVEGLDVPGNVTVRYAVHHDAYRQLLNRASVVVTPTHAPAYPGGQSTLLEAMATGAPCIVTDSAAMRDYVEHDRTALLVPPHDPTALRAAIAELVESDVRRESLGAAGAEQVRATCSFTAAWAEVSAVLRAAAASA